MLTMRTILMLVVVLFSDLVLAQSQVPSPTPTEAEQKNQTQTKDEGQSTDANQRGTESPPLVIKVEKTRDYTSSEWWLVYITGALVLATCGLIIYTARLWGATKSIVDDSKKTAAQQATDMKTSLATA